MRHVTELGSVQLAFEISEKRDCKSVVHPVYSIGSVMVVRCSCGISFY